MIQAHSELSSEQARFFDSLQPWFSGLNKNAFFFPSPALFKTICIDGVWVLLGSAERKDKMCKYTFQLLLPLQCQQRGEKHNQNISAGACATPLIF